MQDFIASVEDGRLAELLEVATNGKGAFRRFKDVLARHPEEREKWFRFKDERVEQSAGMVNGRFLQSDEGDIGPTSCCFVGWRLLR